MIHTLIIPPLVVTVVLDSNQYSLTEGGSGMMAIVSLTAGLSLEKDVELTVETTDGTATGTSTSLGFCEVQPCSLHSSRW